MSKKCKKETLVYNLGSEAGFFSEYNNMVLAILYCLKHNINFVLYSKKANFAIEKGWQDYFLPFCEETEDVRHSKYNIRQSIYCKNLSFVRRLKVNCFKLLTHTNYLTYELWDKFHCRDFENEIFTPPYLQINVKTREASKAIIEKTWHYNEHIAQKVNEHIAAIEMPSKYIGLHIRGGDKYIETEGVEVNKYMEIAGKKSDIKSVFISTDDYRIYELLSSSYSDYKFYTLCKQSSHGYYQSDFELEDKKKKLEDMVLLFASMELLSSSEIFIGTFSSNIGMYLGMRMDADKVYGVDMDNWVIW